VRVTTALEFRIPISPLASMYSNVRFAAMSLARLGPPYSTARIVVSVGDCASHEQVLRETPWAHALPLEWRVAPHQECETNPCPASGNDRYAEGPRADVVVLCDADLCVIDRFDDLLAALGREQPAVAGLQAHYPPFHQREAAANDGLWKELLAEVDAPTRALQYPYSMAPDGSQGRGPAYFNYGFVAFNRRGFQRVAPLVTKYTAIACRFLTDRRAGDPGYQSQVGLALAIAVAGLDVVPLGHEYNCANDDRVLACGLGDPAAVKALHYLRTEEFDRNNFLCDLEAHRRFTAAPLRGRVSERLRQHVVTFADPVLDIPRP
jgi:hypothetical protein